jgi:hypothetical protein
MAIENVLIRVREATREINRATDDPRMKVIIEKSWLLQDRLVFPDRVGRPWNRLYTRLTFLSQSPVLEVLFVLLDAYICVECCIFHGRREKVLMANI